MDLASAKGMDLKSAAELVGRSIGTETNALARQGVELDTNATKTEKLAAVTTVLTAKFGGQAAAEVEGANSTQLMWKALDKLQEMIGGVVAPFIILVSEKVLAMADTVKNATAVWEFMHGAMMSISGIFSVVSAAVQLVAGQIVVHFSTMGQVVNAVLEGNFSAIPGIVGGYLEKTRANAKNTWDTMAKDISKSYQKHTDILQEKASNEQELLEASERRKAEIVKEGADAQLLEKQRLYEEDQLKRAEAFEKEQADFQLKSESQMAQLEVERQIRADADTMEKLEALNRTIAFETDRTAVIAAENEKRAILDRFYKTQEKALDDKHRAEKKAKDQEEQKRRFAEADTAEKFDMFMSDRKIALANRTLSDLSRMQDSKNKEMAAIGKAAAIAQISVDTARAVMGVWGWAAGIPFVGPAIAAGLSGLIIAYGAEQISRVNSTRMAEGGIVTARSGGMLATIGEAGKDEAVIPLDDPSTMERLGGVLGGNGVTIVVNGGLLGDAASARELALALDRELLKLRQSNQSLAFDSGVV
jgi:hypothetical protein